jgi:hypothetical protein
MNVKRPSRPASRSFDKELAELDALKGRSLDPKAVEFLRNTLGHTNNFIVSKAATLVADAELFHLLPEVLEAYDRFFDDAVNTDPQCWAKNALAKALIKLEHSYKEEYLRGMRHHQLEPVWGGSSDTAGALRAICTHALIDCQGIPDADLLTALLEPLVDTDKTVRKEAARVIGEVGGMGGALVLRLRAMIGKDEPEVLGAVYSSLLAVEGAYAIPLVAGYMKDGDDIGAEAAFALADSRLPEALAALTERFEATVDPWFGSVLLSAIAVSRLPEAVEFLIALIAQDAALAPEAVEAIGRTAPNPELRARVEETVVETGSGRLLEAFRKHLPPA